MPYIPNKLRCPQFIGGGKGKQNEENVVGCVKRKSEVSKKHRAGDLYDGSEVIRSGIIVDP
jgi:hypothetical protein